jgi:PAS domain S-box-containing protein
MSLSLSWLFDSSGFTARWDCGNWPLWLGWLHIVSDILIGLAYVVIPIGILCFLRRRDTPFPALFWLFGVFILTCGATHFLEAVIFCAPVYRLAGVVKVITAIASWATVIVLLPTIPKILAMRTPLELERVVAARTAELAWINADLQQEVIGRLRVERSLAQERERFRLILASIGDGVFATDRQGRIRFLNQVACVLTRWTEEDALGRTVEEVFPVVHEVTRLPLESPTVLALRQGKPVALTNNTLLLVRGGGERPIETCIAPIREEGDTAGAVVVFRDVTDRRESQETQARIAAIVNSSEDAIIGKTLDGKITNWNQAAERLFGYTEAEVLGKPISLLMPSELTNQMPEILARIQHGERIRHFETVRVRKDGSRVNVSLSISPVRNDQGQIIGAAKIVRDITLQKQAEEALRLRDRAIQAVNLGIVITDPNLPDNPIIYASPGFERLTNYLASEMVGHNCRFLQGPHTDLTVVAQLKEAVRQLQPCSVEILNYKKDGTPFWNALAISPVYGGENGVSHFVGIQSDVTERRLLEDQYRQSQKMEVVGQLAGGVAHDFNNLLCIINGYGEMLLQKLPSSDPNRQMMEEIARAGGRAAGLTRQLLTFSRKAVLDPQVLDLNTVVADLEKMLRRTISEDISLHVHLAPGLGHVKADPGQVDQILMNLCVNARDAMPQGGKLTIETRNVELDEVFVKSHSEVKSGRYVLVAVSDTGYGMTEKVKSHIFEPFFTTKEKGKGTGLGLSTVYGIVKQSEGILEVHSQVGLGTTFKVYLPLVEEKVTPRKSSVPFSAAPEGHETVLLVEDEDSVRALARIVLLSRGYVVLEAKHGLHALQVAAEHPGPIQLLVSDVIMPKLAGPELARQLLALHPTMKVLFLSGYTDEAVLPHGILQDDANFLQKPFSPTALTHLVREVLDASA